MTGEDESVDSRTDFLTPAERKERMGRVRSKDTKTEMTVRRLVHGLGFRYRLHSRQLPGCPDMVFSGRAKVIFVHGCFWHLHENCTRYRLPKANRDFWMPKLEATKLRDELNMERLELLGWKIMIIWECELRDKDALARRVVGFLEGTS
jgi:DNA mismatch endonuclease (patch repair protein)